VRKWASAPQWVFLDRHHAPPTLGSVTQGAYPECMGTAPTDAAIESCAAALRSGGVVAFPTETVYGLGVNALDESAIERVYTLKGRPRTSPLIVHVVDLAAARALAASWPDAADRLATRFWPGPLTLIVPKSSQVPDAVTAGLSTVGLRVPAHPVAQRLLAAAGFPIAAPSANPFTQLSATRAEHVRAAFGDRVEHMLDAGPTPIGIESTVVSFAGQAARLLRPGAIALSELRSVVPEILAGPEDAAAGTAHESPGQHRRHYSPRTRLLLAAPSDTLPDGVGAWVHHSGARAAGRVIDVSMPNAARAYAAALYATLHDLDARGLDWIAVERPPATAEWDAVRDRLERGAAAPASDRAKG